MFRVQGLVSRVYGQQNGQFQVFEVYGLPWGCAPPLFTSHQQDDWVAVKELKLSFPNIVT